MKDAAQRVQEQSPLYGDVVSPWFQDGSASAVKLRPTLSCKIIKSVFLCVTLKEKYHIFSMKLVFIIYLPAVVLSARVEVCASLHKSI